jgi:hypothetical protein
MGRRLGAQGSGLADDSVDRRRPCLALLKVIRRAETAQRREGHHRGRQPKLELAPSPFLDRSRQGHGALVFGRLLTGLNPGLVRGDSPGDDARIARPVVSFGGQTVLRQGDELGIGTAAIQPPECIGGVAPHRLAHHLGLASRRIGRLAGQDLAEDRPQPEHVDPLVQPIPLAGCLLGRHVRRRTEHAAGFRLVDA